MTEYFVECPKCKTLNKFCPGEDYVECTHCLFYFSVGDD